MKSFALLAALAVAAPPVPGRDERLLSPPPPLRPPPRPCPAGPYEQPPFPSPSPPSPLSLLTPREREQLAAFKPAGLAVIARALDRLGGSPPTPQAGAGAGVRHPWESQLRLPFFGDSIKQPPARRPAARVVPGLR